MSYDIEPGFCYPLMILSDCYPSWRLNILFLVFLVIIVVVVVVVIVVVVVVVVAIVVVIIFVGGISKSITRRFACLQDKKPWHLFREKID